MWLIIELDEDGIPSDLYGPYESESQALMIRSALERGHPTHSFGITGTDNDLQH